MSTEEFLLLHNVSPVPLGVPGAQAFGWTYRPMGSTWASPRQYTNPFFIQRPIHDRGAPNNAPSAQAPEDIFVASMPLDLRQGWKRYIGYVNEMATPFQQALPWLFRSTMVIATGYSLMDAWLRSQQVKAYTYQQTRDSQKARHNQRRQFFVDLLFHAGSTVILPVLLIQQAEKSVHRLLPKLSQKLPTFWLKALSQGAGFGMIPLFPKILDPLLEHGLKPFYPNEAPQSLASPH